jgi:predicted transposase YbfD/YdcC
VTQRSIAQRIVDGGGDYVMIVKHNQRQLRADMEQAFAMVPWGDRQVSTTSLDIGQGRIEQRTVTTSEALVGYCVWPGLAQVCRIERHVITQKGAKERIEVVYGVTSLSAEGASAAQLLAWVREHWHIKHQLYGVRDVTFDEDRSQVRCGSMPQIMAALRHTGIGLLRAAGYGNIAKACHQMAGQPQHALALIGIEMEN